MIFSIIVELQPSVNISNLHTRLCHQFTIKSIIMKVQARIICLLVALVCSIQAQGIPELARAGVAAQSGMADDRVIFSAILDKSPAAITKNTNVVFDTATINVGDAYDSTTGIFTAPKDGIYTFSFGLRSYSEGGIFAHLRVNDVPQAEIYTGTGSTSFASTTRILGLKAKDEVNVVLYYTSTTGNSIDCNDWMPCIFNGQML